MPLRAFRQKPFHTLKKVFHTISNKFFCCFKNIYYLCNRLTLKGYG